MKEMVKTAIYVAAAVLVALTAVLTYPKQEDFQPPDLVGQPLFPEFEDPAKAAELQILTFREDIGRLSEFVVARDPATGLWVIPSSGNYPADADAQMRDAVTALIGLEVLGVQSDSARDHATYGVIEPTKQTNASQEGVGLLVTVRDDSKRELAQLIIGKRVRGEQQRHFVRRPGIDSVCVVNISAEKFPTDFHQWIDRDLLNINPLDVADVTLRDYTVVTTQEDNGTRATTEERFEATVGWNQSENSWRLTGLVEFRDGQPHPAQMLQVEEVNSERLTQLVTALDEMQIVDVLRKPEELGKALIAGSEVLGDDESRASLIARGFYPLSIRGGNPELRAANGDMLISLKNGVQFVLRFGAVADISIASEEGKLSRFLFVSAQLDESKFPPLELEPVPGDDAAATPDLELERERINKDNQRKQDEREEQLKTANRIVAELNARFADWYYVISEDEYKRVRLARRDVIRESAAAREQGFGVDAFRQLQQEGLQLKSDEEAGAKPAPKPSIFAPYEQR